LTAFRIRENISNMDGPDLDTEAIDDRIARRLRALRAERGWSLDALAQRSGVSRATLSRLENAEVSPTTSVLGKLCAAYGLSVSRLMHLVEDGFAPAVRRAEQPVWADPEIGFRRRSVSPPARPLAGEAVECTIDPDTTITYDAPSRPGLEHHLVMLEGRLTVTVDGQPHTLRTGDCLRYQLYGPSAFVTPAGTGARYLLFMV
jgi:transcriptional regulator with XRE-family HTH domain